MCDLNNGGVLSTCTILYTGSWNFQQLAGEQHLRYWLPFQAPITVSYHASPSPSPPSKQGRTPIRANTIAFGLIGYKNHITLLQKSRIHNWINIQIQYHSLVYRFVYFMYRKSPDFFCKAIVSCPPDITAYPNIHCCHFHSSPPSTVQPPPPPPPTNPLEAPPPITFVPGGKLEGFSWYRGLDSGPERDGVPGA